jgi:hypothetical protein
MFEDVFDEEQSLVSPARNPGSLYQIRRAYKQLHGSYWSKDVSSARPVCSGNVCTCYTSLSVWKSEPSAFLSRLAVSIASWRRRSSTHALDTSVFTATGVPSMSFLSSS